MRYRHVSLLMTRECTQYCTIPLAVPEDWDDKRVRAVVEAHDMLNSITDAMDGYPKWSLDDEPGDLYLEHVDSDADTPTVAVEIDGEDDKIVSRYKPAWQDPPPDAWIDVDGTRWATDGFVLVREGASVHPRGWCQWRRRYEADALPSPKAVAEILADAQRETVVLTGGDPVANEHVGVVRRFDGAGFCVALDERYTPEELAGLRIAGHGSLDAVCFYEPDGTTLAFLAMPIRPADR